LGKRKGELRIDLRRSTADLLSPFRSVGKRWDEGGWENREVEEEEDDGEEEEDEEERGDVLGDVGGRENREVEEEEGAVVSGRK